MTRNDYIVRRTVSHEDYYSSLVAAANIDLSHSSLMPKVRKALANGDDNLNTVPMAYWDAIAMSPLYKRNITAALRSHEDAWSLGSAVCILKRAAIIAAQQQIKNEEYIKCALTSLESPSNVTDVALAVSTPS